MIGHTWTTDQSKSFCVKAWLRKGRDRQTDRQTHTHQNTNTKTHTRMHVRTYTQHTHKHTHIHTPIHGNDGNITQLGAIQFDTSKKVNKY